MRQTGGQAGRQADMENRFNDGTGQQQCTGIYRTYKRGQRVYDNRREASENEAINEYTAMVYFI